ncbi:MAG: molybdopterin converting factor subunit 1 [Proteobacteria bacterium]|uniref:molybdopterin converting factor subunit 1 n=1 Tax=Thauera sp. 2A1 TaxID=2570191 RepID=UPI00129163EA|nr:molybdopterin converting factor subunit 1 [Thauera sp. 2A1]KAI5916048.1 molybdopterin converting factor subunit 1 [Thauera sp. 2A1]MBS0510545.1 molybdopterin converting factor subunit 1 [Pseudomonadota bacterium]MBS0552755.1 molybdopterin converting factor subunit 1 [Pseudomonadota bacterium]
MALRILYFAALREALGVSAEDFDPPAGVASVSALRACLVARGGVWEKLAAANVKAAVNQRMVGGDASVGPGDEVAFFPPVTGG